MGKENKPLPEKFSAKNILENINRKSALNVISSEAYQAYSIRSSSPEYENELIDLIKGHVNEINQKYQDLVEIEIEVVPHLKPFVKGDNEFLTSTVIEAGEKIGLNIKPLTFHAGAETHVLANDKKNAYGDSFIPLILGVADMENIHSTEERIDWKSSLKGRQLLELIIITYAQTFKKW